MMDNIIYILSFSRKVGIGSESKRKGLSDKLGLPDRVCIVGCENIIQVDIIGLSYSTIVYVIH